MKKEKEKTYTNFNEIKKKFFFNFNVLKDF